MKNEKNFFRNSAQSSAERQASVGPIWKEVLERCFENTLMGMAVMDRNFNFIRVNMVYAEMDDKDVSYFPGRNHFDLYPSDAKQIFEQVVETKTPYQTFARPFVYAQNPERGVTYWDWTLEPIDNDTGSVELLLLTLNNVTTRVNMERELVRLERLNLIGQMAGGIGHEIRNPMTTVRGFLQMMSEKKEYSKDEKYFEIMISELDRANVIITEFLSLSKKENPQTQIRSLKEVVEKISPLIEAQALKLNRNVVFVFEDTPALMLDDKEIRQMLLNLVQNALEASPPRDMITVRIYREDGNAVIMVQDGGPGISSDVLQKLGTPFLTTKDNGTGLGLAICYSIVRRHNGKIDVESGKDGTTFRVYLPLETQRLKESNGYF